MEQYRSLSKLRFVIAFVAVVSLKKIRDGSAKQKKTDQKKTGRDNYYEIVWFQTFSEEQMEGISARF